MVRLATPRAAVLSPNLGGGHATFRDQEASVASRRKLKLRPLADPRMGLSPELKISNGHRAKGRGGFKHHEDKTTMESPLTGSHMARVPSRALAFSGAASLCDVAGDRSDTTGQAPPARLAQCDTHTPGLPPHHPAQTSVAALLGEARQEQTVEKTPRNT